LHSGSPDLRQRLPGIIIAHTRIPVLQCGEQRRHSPTVADSPQYLGGEKADAILLFLTVQYSNQRLDGRSPDLDQSFGGRGKGGNSILPQGSDQFLHLVRRRGGLLGISIGWESQEEQ